MDSRALKRGRPVLLVACLAVAALVALPASAYAKTTTRIVAATSTTVVRDTAGVNPWLTKTLKATLQKRITSTHYHGLSGIVKLYKLNLDTQAYAYTRISRKSSSAGSVTFPIAGRGKYKLYYAGSSTMRAATKYSTVFENIGLTVSAPTITFEQIGTTARFWVNATYTVGWNTEAWDPMAEGAAVSLEMEAFFRDVPDEYEGDWVWYQRDFMEPGTVEFNYKVAESQVTEYPVLQTHASAYVDQTWDPYIVNGGQVSANVDVVPVYN